MESGTVHMVKRALEMAFRKLFGRIYESFSPTEPKNLFNSGNGERMSRFLLQQDEFRGGVVRHSAFTPPKSRRKSIYWISAISDKEIWNIGDTHVAPARNLPILGRADFNSLVVYQHNLAIDLTGIPHPRHADIIDWDQDRKTARPQAQELADASTLIRKP